jgi:hypothetical protein
LTDDGTEQGDDMQPTIYLENEVNEQTGEGKRVNHSDGERKKVGSPTSRPSREKK